MSWFTSLLGGGAEKPIKAIGDVFDELFTSDDERAASNIVMEKLKQHPGELQVGLNKIEANHKSVFVAGWRPAIGWVCAISLFFFYVPQYVVATWVWVDAVTIAMEQARVSGNAIVLPQYPVSADAVMELVLAMLGMATIRQVDKMSKRSK